MRSCHLRNSVILVTGATGATGGAVARLLAGQAAHLVLSGRDSKKLETLTRDLNSSGATVTGITCDLLDEAAPSHLVRCALERAGTIQGLVLCAGGARFTFFKKLTHTDFENALRLNLSVNVELIREALPYLTLHTRSWIVFINSIAAREPAPPRGTAYLAAKAGALHFAESLFSEMRDNGVSVTSILPDLIDSSMIPDVSGYDRGSLIRPESVASAVLYAMTTPPDACVTEIHLRPQPSLRFKK